MDVGRSHTGTGPEPVQRTLVDMIRSVRDNGRKILSATQEIMPAMRGVQLEPAPPAPIDTPDPSDYRTMLIQIIATQHAVANEIEEIGREMGDPHA